MAHIYPPKGAVNLKPLFSLFFTTVLACGIYLILEDYSLKHSALLFIGVPLFISFSLAITYTGKHLTFHILSGLTIGLLASFIYLNEGSFCAPTTAPLFLIAGLTVSFSFKYYKSAKSNKLLYLIPSLFLLLISLEGITSLTSLNRSEVINVSDNVDMTSNEITSALTQTKQFTDLPLLLRWGFPQPKLVSGSGIEIGDVRSVYFEGGEGEPGTAIFKITAKDANSITYTLISDSSHISHWLDWKTTTVSWSSLDNGLTEINWRISYDRKLDPAWYFAPLQFAAVELAAKALISNMITNNTHI